MELHVARAGKERDLQCKHGYNNTPATIARTSSTEPFLPPSRLAPLVVSSKLHRWDEEGEDAARALRARRVALGADVDIKNGGVGPAKACGRAFLQISTVAREPHRE